VVVGQTGQGNVVARVRGDGDGVIEVLPAGATTVRGDGFAREVGGEGKRTAIDRLHGKRREDIARTQSTHALSSFSA